MAPKIIIDALSEMKTAVDLHTATYTQLITARCLELDLMKKHLPYVRGIYKQHAECMLNALETYLPKHPQIKWTHPKGGMFIWLELPENVDATELLKACIAAEVPVAFVPGFAFYANHPKHNTARLSFVTVPEEKIVAGVKTIAETLQKFL